MACRCAGPHSWPIAIAPNFSWRRRSQPTIASLLRPNRCGPSGLAPQRFGSNKWLPTIDQLSRHNSRAHNHLRIAPPTIREVASKIPGFFFPTLGVWRSLNLLAGYRPYRTLFGRSTVRDWVATAARPSRVRPSPLREIPGEQVSWYDPDIGMTVPPSALRPNCRPASPKGTDLVMGDRR